MLPGAKLWFGAHHLTLRLAHVAHVVVTAHVAHGADLSLGRKSGKDAKCIIKLGASRSTIESFG
jgi:hypothetical protein